MDSVRIAVPSESTPVDLDDLLVRCLGRIDLAERILKKFETVLEADLQQLESAVHARDTEEIAHLAHRIKGASLAVSARPITECAKCLEVAATACQLEEIPYHLECLKKVGTQFFEFAPTLSQRSFGRN